MPRRLMGRLAGGCAARSSRRLAGRLGGLSGRERAAVATVAVAVGLCLTGLWAVLSPSQGASPDPGSEPIAAPGTLAALPTGDTPETVRIQAPAGGIDVPVREGDGVHVPLQVALHYPGTAEPGMGGNSLFYAHAQPGMFLGLYRLHLGDGVTFIRADGSELHFHVTSVKRVPYNDFEVLKATPFEQATLLTCTSYDPTTPRLIVTASPA